MKHDDVSSFEVGIDRQAIRATGRNDHVYSSSVLRF
jgi:hypothetical protein